MQISLDTILRLPSEGRITLQVPTLYIGGAPTNTQTFPDDWFHWVTHMDAPACGNEKGFLYLTSVGYTALKKDIKASYLKACGNGLWRGYDRLTNPTNQEIWDDFDQEIQKHFNRLRKNHRKALHVTKQKLDFAKKFGTKKSVTYWSNKLKELQNYTV